MTVLSSIADKFINFPAIPAGRHIFICRRIIHLAITIFNYDFTSTAHIGDAASKGLRGEIYPHPAGLLRIHGHGPEYPGH